MTEVTEVSMTRREQLIEATKLDGRQLVSIRKIDDLIPIPGADRIVTAMVGGWPVVVKSGEFQVGQLGVFFEVDSFLNNEDPRFDFLATKRVKIVVDGVEKEKVEDVSSEWNGIKGIRLKSIRLRKQLSQGLILPLNLFPEIATPGADGGWVFQVPGEDLSVVWMGYGDDDSYDTIRKINYTTTLGVIKWEKLERNSGGANLAGKTAGNFPEFLRKSDQTRCQNLNQEIFGYDQRIVPFNPEGIPPDAVAELLRTGKVVKTEEGLVRIFPATASPDREYEVSIKMDGSSMTAYGIIIRDEDGYDVYKTGVCSRNLELDTEGNEGNTFVDMFHTVVKPILDLPHGFGSIALQGELCGAGIQGNQEQLDQYEFFVFNIFDIDRQEFMLPTERRAVLSALNRMAEARGLTPLKQAPVLFTGVKLSDLGVNNMQDLLKFAEGPSYNVKVEREGLVFKAMDCAFQFKVISNKWLIQNDA